MPEEKPPPDPEVAETERLCEDFAAAASRTAVWRDSVLPVLEAIAPQPPKKSMA